MSVLKYIGRPPDTDSSVTTQASIDRRRSQVSVTQADVDAALALRTNSLALKTYIDQQDAAGVTKSYVDTQDAKYLDKTLIGTANGPVPLLSSGKISNALVAVSANAPRGPRYWSKTSGWTDSGLTSTTQRTLGSFTLPDPGYKYFPVITGGGFESLCSANGDCRPDINVRLNTTSGAGLAYGTSKLGDTYSRVPVSIVPDTAAGTSFTGTLTAYITTVRGFGSGSYYMYCASAYLNIVLMPIV